MTAGSARPGGSSAADSTTFLDLRKSDSERLRIQIGQYRGRTFIDLRVWYSTEFGEYKPSRAGVSLHPGQVAEVVQGLLVASRAIDPKGVS
jgi:Transcriptional Coactivator p15 (PC4)